MLKGKGYAEKMKKKIKKGKGKWISKSQIKITLFFGLILKILIYQISLIQIFI